MRKKCFDSLKNYKTAMPKVGESVMKKLQCIIESMTLITTNPDDGNVVVGVKWSSADVQQYILSAVV